MNYEGFFVTVEGIDGAGKSTVVDAIQKEFDSALVTSEPTEYNTGRLLRELLQDEESSPVTDFHAFMADRKKHIEDFIKPNLRDGFLVVSDRYADSTRAYQTELLRGEVVNPSRYIRRTMDPWNLPPDLTIYIDIPAEVSMDRVDSGEKYEDEDFLKLVHRNYTLLGQQYEGRWVEVDGTQDEDDMVDEVVEVVRKNLEVYYDE